MKIISKKFLCIIRQILSNYLSLEKPLIFLGTNNFIAPNQTGNTTATKTADFAEINADNQINSLLILDEKSFLPKWSFFLDNQEIGQSILSCKVSYREILK